VDTGKLADKARAFLGTLPAEVKSVIEGDPAIAAKLAELGRGRAEPSIEVKPVGGDGEPVTQRPRAHADAE
jgi:hypothetical protein